MARWRGSKAPSSSDRLSWAVPGRAARCAGAKRSAVKACASLGLSHHYTRPYTPRTNGKAERFIQSSLREWAYARAYANSNQRGAALPTWLHAYNWHRPHTSLAGQPPVSRLNLNRNNLLRLHI